MKRRQALQNIAFISAGMAFLPACEVDNWPVWSNLPLERQQKQLIAWLTEAILPINQREPLITTPEPPAHFVLTMVNDCFSTEDLNIYVEGLKEFQQYIQSADLPALKKLTSAQSHAMLTQLSEDEGQTESLRYFLHTTRRLTIQHFTTSEYFMKNNLGFEFVPGRFKGCVPI